MKQKILFLKIRKRINNIGSELSKKNLNKKKESIYPNSDHIAYSDFQEKKNKRQNLKILKSSIIIEIKITITNLLLRNIAIF